MRESQPASLLDVVLRCDRILHADELEHCPIYAHSADFYLADGTLIGWMQSGPFQSLRRLPGMMSFLQTEDTTPERGVVRVRSTIAPDLSDASSWAQKVAEKISTTSLDNIPKQSRAMFASLDAPAQKLTILLAAVIARWREEKAFAPLQGWRNEMYTVYGANHEPCFMIERAACGLFGVVTYGAHLNAYVLPPPLDQGQVTLKEIKAHRMQTRVWCPRRAMNKATYPGMLDNTVAGGISNGLTPFETIVKEADEEASIPEQVALRNTVAAGAISYLYADGEVMDGAGFVQPEVQYIYDLELADPSIPGAIIPRPNDGESEAFELLDCHEMLDLIRKGLFKPNCALVLIDFMIRHGILTEEDDGDFLEIQARLHRRLPFPTR